MRKDGSSTVSRDCSDERKVHTQRLCALGGGSRQFRPVKRPLVVDTVDDHLESKRRRHGGLEDCFAITPGREEQASNLTYAPATPILTI